MDPQAQIDALVRKVKHLILTTSNHTAKDATIEEIYHAVCLGIREEIMIHTNAAIATIQKEKCRMVNFLSMEYMPGRLLGNNVINMGADELVRTVLGKLDINFGDLMSCDSDPGLGNGGLGRLSSCFLDSLATLHYPARGYGLRYQYGIFEQEIWNGRQVERPDCWLLSSYPWEARRDLFSVNVHFRGTPVPAQNKYGNEVYLIEDGEEVRALPFDVPIIGFANHKPWSSLLLRLWSTKESPRNFLLQRYNAGLLDQAAENTSLTDVLYPNDNTDLGKRVRLKQEFILVSASLQDIIRRHFHTYGDLSEFADKVRIQINDTHPALMIAEIMRVLPKNYDFSWKKAWEVCQQICSYTNHTILREALEEWNEKRMRELLPRQYRVIQKLNQEFCNSIRKQHPGDEERVRRLSIIENGQIRMAHLAIYGSHKVNGVAHLHTEILKHDVFKDFYELSPEKFVNVTNGVTQRRWLLTANPLLADFITKRIGDAWPTQFHTIAKLREFASDPKSQQEFLAIKKQNKENLIHFLERENFIRDAAGKVVAHPHILTADALFDVHVKRFHEYKRQLMNALHLIMLYQEGKRKVPRFSIFAGKAAPGYDRAKKIVQLICAIGRKFHTDSTTRGRLCVSFIENYNVSRAEIIAPAADLSEQISTAGWEASGTGNMKLSMNGALTIGTEDGANIEMRKAITDRWCPFRFGATAEQNKEPYSPETIYQNDEAIRQAVDALKSGEFALSASERADFNDLHRSLVTDDPFRILQDLRSYYEMQKQVEALYLQPNLWAETAMHNIAGMGPFSTDESIHNYATKIWGLKPCPPDTAIFQKVRADFTGATS
jgi:glycogen phosphorylase